MAQLAIALAASGAASYGVSAGFLASSYLGMSTVGIGWTIGSMVGSMMNKQGGQDAQGPRLSDKSVQGSSYGEFIPITYGSMRVAGNIIWATNLVEVSKTQKSGGKGGGGSSSYTTYSYFANFATMLCEGPIDAVQRIWADGRLIYDISPNSETRSQISSSFKVFNGTETQKPSAFIESIEGVGNVPAYRGRAYVVFNRFPLAEYGNRIPNFTFEVIKGEQFVKNVSFIQTNSGTQNFGGRGAVDKNTSRCWWSGTKVKDGITYNYLKCTNFETGALIYEHYFEREVVGVATYSFASQSTGTAYNELSACVYVPVKNEVWIAPGAPSNADFFWIHDADTGQFKRYIDKVGGSWMQKLVYDEHSQKVLLFSDNLSARMVIYDPELLFYVPNPAFITNAAATAVQEIARAKIYLYTDDLTGKPVYTSNVLSGPRSSKADCYITSLEYGQVETIKNDTDFVTCLHDSKRNIFVLFLYHETDSDKFYIKTVQNDSPFTTLNIKQVNTPIYNNSSIIFSTNSTCIYIDYLDKYVLIANNPGVFSYVFYIDPDTLNIDYFYYFSNSGISPNTTGFARGSYAETNNNWLLGFPGGSVNEFAKIPLEQTTSDEAAVLSSIVSDISSRVGLLPSQINVSGMNDEVPGYIITKQAPARAALEPLLTAYFYDSVESST